MKSIISIIVVLVSVQYVFAQMPSNCTVSNNLQYYYDRDVKHLALKRIYEQHLPAMDSIIIPQSYQDTIWEAVAAVYNLVDFPARDTVFDIYCIHQYASYYIFYSIHVELEPSCSWFQQWQNLNTTTGVPALDTLLSTYGFTVTKFWHNFNFATLTTNQTINVRPVCDSIAKFDGVVYAEPEPPIGFGDEIHYDKTGTDRFLDFVIGYGDCPLGCTGFLTLSFVVFEDCSVQYSGSILEPAPGYAFPPPVNCNITTGFNNKNISLKAQMFPNPVSDMLNISLEVIGKHTVILTTINGQQLMLMESSEKDHTIDMSSYPRGVYFLTIRSKKNVSIEKIIKQ